ncbi:MAG: sugar ABC transporter permease [Clostridia bacterium]|nr:sugar ABC transporter permease [Oscillospiraceae bacterium]MBO4933433.1 sugar ABC transporter permease [Clostridia bacterium]MBO5120032.1 sugar ABC transporter permease [Methanocorpusculum sp.]MBQ8513709.1 sugar ABC transporter permease [Clostridia bacterium]
MSKNTEKQAKTRKEMTKAEWTWFLVKRNKTAYFMIAPFMILFFIFTIIPVALSLVLSFTSFNMLEWPKFIFMDNYITLFLDDDLFITALKNTFIFAAVTGPASYLISYIVAWFINELPPRVRAIVTLIFYAPSIAGNVYLIWGTLFSGDAYGWVNGILLDMGIIDTPILWFQNADYVMPLIIMVALWTSLGTSFLSFIAGLQGINKSLFEAGAIDGVKNRWQELWYITLPSMKPQLMFGAILSITGSFGFGGIVTALAGNPSVDYVAYTLTHHLEEYQNNRWEVGYASAISFILFLIMIGCNVLISKLISKLGE